jgi:hypothetical protein
MDAMALRCKSCGAPLPGEATGELLTCEHCGTVQRLVDARAFLDQISLQINSFLRQALPAGLDVGAGGGSIDPIARHNIFVQGVRPSLETEYRELKFRCFDLLSHGQIALPFTVASGLSVQNDPKDAFIFQAKVRSVSSLAVDDESRKLMAEVDGIATTYAHLLTNVGFLTQPRPERYPFIARNCKDAADTLKNVPQLAALQSRLQGLSHLGEALDQITQGHPKESRPALQAALADLTQAHSLAQSDFNLSLMITGIEEEISLAQASGYLADILLASQAGSSSRTLLAVQALLKQLTVLLPNTNPTWAVNMGKASRVETLLWMTAEMRKAQMGQGSVKSVRSPGSLIVPFWVVEVPYSFQTGALWKARGVEVAEAMLVAATFPLDLGALSLTDPSRVVTDVFGAREQVGWRDRVAGRETAISGGGLVRNVVAGAAPGPLPTLPGVPPLSTSDEASLLVQQYLTWSRRRDREIDQKLRLSSPRIVDLIYIPSTPEAAPGPVIPWMGPLSPRSVGEPPVLSALAFS